VGSKGYSLKLDGMEKGYNDNMRQRAVVMHDAEYVSDIGLNTTADWEEARDALRCQKKSQKK
jgi:hypothetical protein